MAPKAQAKLIYVVRGEILDVAVDIRQGSPTYAQSVSCILNEHNHHQMYIPEGFAHGFLVLSDIADVIYKMSTVYAPEYERGVLWNDPGLNLNWPAIQPILSERDQKQNLLKNADNNFFYTESQA